MMRFSKQGDWQVGTPVYVGTGDQVSLATKCRHDEYKLLSQTVIDQGILSVVERCTKCIAVRSKFRPATKEEIAEWKTKRNGNSNRKP